MIKLWAGDDRAQEYLLTESSPKSELAASWDGLTFMSF